MPRKVWYLMYKITRKSKKVKSKNSKRLPLSVEHRQRIQKLRSQCSPLRLRFQDDLKLHHFAINTINRYVDAAIVFVAYFNKPPQLIQDDEIRSYLKYQSETRGLKSGSMGIIHGALTFLYNKTLQLKRPILEIYRTKKDAPEKILLSQDEVRNALACIQDIRYRTALELIYSCGLRENEALNLTVEQIYRSQELIQVKGKGNKNRFVPISKIMIDKLTILWKSHRHENLLFPAYESRRRLGTPRKGALNHPIIGQTLLNVWKKAVAESGCKKNINVHTLRHCYGTHLLEEGASMRSVQDNLGHTNSRTTSVYIHQTAKRTRQSADAVERISKNIIR